MSAIKHKPATALPWVIGMRGGANANMIMSHSGPDKHDDPAICQMYGIPINLKLERCGTAEGMPNAEYLVHAANAYPLLVEAVRKYIDNEPGSRFAAYALLLELGESP